MKACPNCAAENRNEAVICYNCGRDISYVPPDTVERTQPRQVRSPGSPPTDPHPPAGYPQQDPDQTQPGASGYPSPSGYPQQGTYGPPPGYQGTYPQQPGYPPPGTYPQQPGYQGTYPYPPGYPPQGTYPQQPGYGGPPQGTYPQQPGYGYPVYPPPPTPPAQPEPRSRAWPVLAVSLGLGLVCVCMLAMLAVTATTAGGIAGFRSQVSTQFAGVAVPTSETPQPTEIGMIASPTSWPTLTPTESPTPQPTDTPWPTQTPVPTEPPAAAATQTAVAAQPADGAEPTPNPTQAVQIDKMLSPECNQAMTEMGGLSSEFGKNPFKLLDGAWREAVSTAMGDLKTACGTLDAASPVPGRVAEAQRNLGLATSEWDAAKQLWTEGINNRDPGKFIESGSHITQAGKYLDQALAAMKEVVP